jgi:endoglucanase
MKAGLRRATALAMLFTLGACGGGSGGGGGSVSATPVPPSPPPPPPPPPPPTSNPKSYTPVAAAKASAGVALPLGKCVNLSNMLEAPNEGDWGRAFQDQDAARIRQAGFATVRLPVRFSSHAGSAAPYAIDPAFMARVHHVVDTLLAQNLNVILDMHHYLELFDDPDGQRIRFAELWRQVATSFRDAPANVWFELINEPNARLNDSNLLATLTPALAAVRATNPTRPVVIGGQSWSGVDSLATIQFPDDPYLVPTIHTYDPFDFTHQGAPWITPVMPTGRVFGTAADNQQLDSNLVKVQNFMARTGRVPFVGEYGAYEGIPLAQRALYYKTISSAYASIGVQSCAWGYTNTFNLWNDSGGWNAQILNAIATTTSIQ